MNWLSSWWQRILKKGFFFSITRPWPGDGKLPDWNCWPKKVTKEDVEKEIRDSLTKKEDKDVGST
jgi:hypothetical protein